MQANACTNLLGFFVRYVRTRGMDEAMESAKLPTFALPFAARTCHARLARLTRARRGGSQGGRRESSLLTFAALLVTQKRDKTIVSLCIFAGEQCSTLPKSQSPLNRQKKKSKSIPLFLLTKKAQKKKLSKRKRRKKISRSAERDHRCRWTTPPFKKKAGENFIKIA